MSKNDLYLEILLLFYYFLNMKEELYVLNSGLLPALLPSLTLGSLRASSPLGEGTGRVMWALQLLWADQQN